MKHRPQGNLPPFSRQHHGAGGFTLIEMLVVIAVIGMLVMLLLPGIQAARESARRCQCANNLSQLITAVHNYELAFGVYPPGTLEKKGPIQHYPYGYHHSWIVQILPFLEQQNAAALIDRRVGVYHRRNREARNQTFEFAMCPSQAVYGGYSTYAGVHHDDEAPLDKDNDGVFFLNSRLTYDDLSDGAAQTLFIGEKIPELGDLGWMSGTRATVRNTGASLNTTGVVAGGGFNWARSWNYMDAGEDEADLFSYGAEDDDGMGGMEAGPDGMPPNLPAGQAASDEKLEPEKQPRGPGPVLPIGGFSSAHPDVCQFAFGDGRVALLSDSIALDVLRQLGHRADGKLLSSGSY